MNITTFSEYQLREFLKRNWNEAPFISISFFFYVFLLFALDASFWKFNSRSHSLLLSPRSLSPCEQANQIFHLSVARIEKQSHLQEGIIHYVFIRMLILGTAHLCQSNLLVATRRILDNSVRYSINRFKSMIRLRV